MISNCGHDENGKYHGGAAGDQTGGEWQIQDWYKRPWGHVLRHPNKDVGAMIAALAIEAANNPNIGYDQYQRTTFYKQLKAAGWHPANITVKCEADCSSGVAAIVIATGHLMGIKALQNVSPDMYTGNERQALKNAGFEVLTNSRYLTSDKYLQPGDILLYEGHHTAINLDYGSEVKPNDNFYGSTGWHEDNEGWWYNYSLKKGEYHCNNAVWIYSDKRKRNELYLFDVEGYVCDGSETELDEYGAVKYIKGKRFK